MFKAIVLEQGEGGHTIARLSDVEEAALPQADVRVAVRWSSLNYKDALAITGRSPIVRKWPMVPGIDFAGVVEHSEHPDWKAGDNVVLTGFGVGESHWGGLSQRAAVKGDWLVGLPAGLQAQQAMAVGTAGFTAMLCLMALERHGLKPGDGEVLVTGASGGVGSVAVALLAKLGYRVVASTGRLAETDYLKSLGAESVIDRATLSESGRPLAKERWAGVVDSVGSHTLANACAATRENGAVAACGLAQGMDFPATVAPFILRGVTLYGINSVTVARQPREQAWARIARDMPLDHLAAMTQTVRLDEVIGVAPRFLDGQVRGRIVVDIPAG
ncbi:MAG: oxidoreductase [Gammaproteobacteria bacterium]|jgi:acrylyl-CoA reductase (NADPH)|nr:oxidoreductase [Gammaproteobacteria bacterium]MBU0771884.1 oxidoreductase [Gammaproteobacteria bacterium]MBU0856095.1 oxidoreductase [Gammaproteobacteria bacterium]MBU1846202.1 oxidoreductase [Gammaproteobacteria bacterium]